MAGRRQRHINTGTTSTTVSSDEQLLSSILRSSNPYPDLNPNSNSDSAHQKPKDQPPPSPFTPLPSSSPLIPFLETLADRSKIYIIHVDTTPRAVKRRVFAIPLLLNTIIVGLLLWRIWIMIPFYTAILGILPSNRSSSDFTSTSTGTTSGADTLNPNEVGPIQPPGKLHPSTLLLILRRTLTFFIDYTLFFHVAGWPFSFFAERAGSPMRWRAWALRGKVRDMEVVVRKSRGWGVEELKTTTTTMSQNMTKSSDKRIIQGAKNPYFHTRIAPAVQRPYLRETTGYMMMSQYWDLDFGAMAGVVGMLGDGDDDNGDGKNSQKDSQENKGEVNGEEKKDARTEKEEGKKMNRKRLSLEDCRTVVVVWDDNDRTAAGVAAADASGRRNGGGRAGARLGAFNATSRSNKSKIKRTGDETERDDDGSDGQWLSWRVF